MKTRFRSALGVLVLVTCHMSLVTSAFADAKTRAAQKTDIETLFPSSVQGAITAEKLRTGLKTMVDSARNDLDDGTAALNSALSTLNTRLSTFASDPSADLSFSASEFRTDLGLVIGTNVQAYDADLTTYAGITPSANVQTLLGAASFAAFKTSLSLNLVDNTADASKPVSTAQAAADAVVLAAAAADATTKANAAQAASQPLDSDLTAIAALTTTSYGRGFLDDADAAATRTNLSVSSTSEIAAAYQPLDSDLTSIAALATTTFGRALLIEATAASARSTLSVPSVAEVAAAYQPLDSDLTSIAGLTTTSNGRSLLTAASLTAAGLGLTNGANIDAWGAKTIYAGSLTITTGKTVAFDHSSTFTTTDSQTYTFPTTSATLARTDAGQTFTGTQAFAGITATSVTNSGLTSGRVPFASTAGLMADASSLTFNSGTGVLTATGFSGAHNGTVGVTTPTTGAFTTVGASGVITSTSAQVGTGQSSGALVINNLFSVSGSNGNVYSGGVVNVSDANATSARIYVLGGASGAALLTLERTVGSTGRWDFSLPSGGLGFTDSIAGLTAMNLFGDNTTNQIFIGQRSKITSDARTDLLSGTTFTSAAGTDVVAHSLTVRSGAGTGAGTVGTLILQTSVLGSTGTTAQTYATRLTLSDTSAAYTVPITTTGTITGGVQALSGAGAVDVTTQTTALTTTGAAQALTLANGTNGLTKTIIHDVDGGSAILTPTTKTGFSTVTFTNAGDTATLRYLTTRGWFVLSSYGAVVAP